MKDKLDEYRVYQLARQLFDEFWQDADVLQRDIRGRELVKQQTRSLDSICANIEEGYGRGFGKEYPQSLRISRGEARESRGRYERMRQLLPKETVDKRTATLDQIIGGSRQRSLRLSPNADLERPLSLATRHLSLSC
ncbi:MAG: four helix bundle protein, partial [Anaerolineales bacterium]